jgi:hypothetical protein
MSSLLNRLFNTNVIDFIRFINSWHEICYSNRIRIRIRIRINEVLFVFEFEGREHLFEYEIAIEIGGGEKIAKIILKNLADLADLVDKIVSYG